MDVYAIFDCEFSGQSGGAVWIADSPVNRDWFERNEATLSPNSALFFVDRYESVQIALCHMIWGIDEHFPDWQRILVIEVDPAIPVPTEILNEGRWEIVQDGLALHRIS